MGCYERNDGDHTLIHKNAPADLQRAP